MIDSFFGVKFNQHKVIDLEISIHSLFFIRFVDFFLLALLSFCFNTLHWYCKSLICLSLSMTGEMENAGREEKIIVLCTINGMYIQI